VSGTALHRIGAATRRSAAFALSAEVTDPEFKAAWRQHDKHSEKGALAVPAVYLFDIRTTGYLQVEKTSLYNTQASDYPDDDRSSSSSSSSSSEPSGT